MADEKLKQILEKLKAGKELSTSEIAYIDSECDIVKDEILEVMDETINSCRIANVLGTLVTYNKFISEYEDDYMGASIYELFV